MHQHHRLTTYQINNHHLKEPSTTQFKNNYKITPKNDKISQLKMFGESDG